MDRNHWHQKDRSCYVATANRVVSLSCSQSCKVDIQQNMCIFHKNHNQRRSPTFCHFSNIFANYCFQEKIAFALIFRVLCLIGFIYIWLLYTIAKNLILALCANVYALAQMCWKSKRHSSCIIWMGRSGRAVEYQPLTP